jgi:CheY-like chemotaxis protein
MQEIKRILVLDDHANLLDIVKEVLIYENYEVKSTASSKELIPLALSYLPDLVMIDCHLAGCNGASLCKQLKAHPQLCHIPAVICSAYVDQNTTIEAYHCDAVIAKPFSMKDLVDTINTLLVVPDATN